VWVVWVWRRDSWCTARTKRVEIEKYVAVLNARS
jgi:hypothetical protein